MKQLPSFTIEDCESVVKKYLKNDDVRTINYDVLQHPTNNYLIKVTVHQNDNQTILNFFAKSKTSENDKKIKANEILFKHFKQLIPGFDVKITPRIVFGNSDFLLYEDIAAQGFHSNSFDLLNIDQLKVAIRVLAKFHGGSLAYEEIKSNNKEESYKLSEDHEFDEITSIFKDDSESVDLICSFSELFGPEDDLRTKLLSFVEDLESRQKSSKFKRTLCHGNLVSENIMFRNDPTSRAPIDCKLINFKPKCYYLPPVYDVLQLIYFNSTKELRQHHLQNLLNFYHNSLREELKKYSLDITKILPEKDFKLSAHHILPLIKLEISYLHSFRFSQSKTDDYFNLLRHSLQELKETLQCDLLSREDIYEIIEEKIGNTNYILQSFTVRPLDEVLGYMGDYFKLKIEFDQHGKGEILNCFVKCMPKGTASNALMLETGAFFKELFVYETLVPLLRKCEITLIDECLPECYFQRPEDLIVFEDISLDNFAIKSSLEPYDFDLLSLTLQKLAKFHGCSLILEKRMSEIEGRPYKIYDQFGEHLQEILYLSEEESDHRGAIMMQLAVKSLKPFLDLFPELRTEETEKKFEEKFSQLRKTFFSATKPSNQFPNVVSHGDLWTNNIMLQFDGNNKPVDCRFIDYQVVRYCSPAQDLLTILYLTTDRKTRIEFEEKLLNIYHDALAGVLSRYNCDLNAIMPYDKFLESVEFMRPQMLIQQIHYGMFTFCTSDQIKMLLSDEATSHRFFYEDRRDYMAQLFEISQPFRERGYENALDFYEYLLK